MNYNLIYLLVVILLFVNLIRYHDLNEYTHCNKIKHYLINYNGIMYNAVIIALFIIYWAFQFVAEHK